MGNPLGVRGCSFLVILSGCLQASNSEPDYSETTSNIIGCANSIGWPCDDDNPCTIDQCVEDQCVYEASSYPSCALLHDWYVAPAPLGSAGGNGTKQAPWTLGHAASAACASQQVHAGDIVNIAAGTYAGLTTLACNNGTDSLPITYISSVKHRAVLDGALPLISWVPAPGAQPNLYRSVSTFDANVYAGFIRLNGAWISLVTHQPNASGTATPLAYLSSNTHPFAANQPRYIGPGVAYNAADSRIYIRLDNSTAQAGRPVTTIINFNPNDQEIRLAPINGASAKCLKITGSNLVVDGLTLTTCGEGVNTNHTGPVSGLTLRGLDVSPIYFGARLGAAEKVAFKNSKFHARLPSLQFWASDGDMHGYDAPAGYNEKKCIDLGAAHDVELIDNEFNEFVDCIMAGASDIVVRGNTFRQIWDDGWQMYRDVHHVDIDSNVFFGAGVSRDNTRSDILMGANSGTIRVHHNLFFPHVRPVWWFRPGYPNVPGDPNLFGFGMGDGIPLSSHLTNNTTAAYAFSWKLYHNTFYVVQPRYGAQLSIGQIGPFQPLLISESPHEAYNNIFVDATGTSLATLYTQGRIEGATTIAKESYDGNVFSGWSTLYTRVTTSAGSISPVASPEALLTCSQCGPIVSDTTSYPIPSTDIPLSQGWEKHGFTHPFPAGSPFDSCYRLLSCPNCATGAVSLTSTQWPGTATYQPWRGAVAPSACVEAYPWSPPESVTATAVSVSRINLSWSPVPTATKYYIYQSVSGGPFVYKTSKTATSGMQTTGITNLSSSTTYSYKIQAVTPVGNSGMSPAVSATTW